LLTLRIHGGWTTVYTELTNEKTIILQWHVPLGKQTNCNAASCKVAKQEMTQ